MGERMKEGQKSIYYVAGESQEALEKSPFLEKLLLKGFEVIYFTDPIDEYTMQNLTEFDEFKFSNASKEDMKFGDADEGEKKQFKKTKEHFKPFTKWWKDAFDLVPGFNRKREDLEQIIHDAMRRGHEQIRLVCQHGAHHESASVIGRLESAVHEG